MMDGAYSVKHVGMYVYIYAHGESPCVYECTRE
jgi:hypothetical protein